MRKGDEAYTFALEGCGIMLGVAVEQFPLIVALDDALVRGPEVPARVFA